MTNFYFDLDGTLANLYGVNNWLEMLRAENDLPYRIATPMVDMDKFVSICRKLKAQGNRFYVVSWGSKNSSASYLKSVKHAKRDWLAHYCPDIWDGIHVLPYDTPKSQVIDYSRIGRHILFDDEYSNLVEWSKWGDTGALLPKDIFPCLEYYLAA